MFRSDPTRHGKCQKKKAKKIKEIKKYHYGIISSQNNLENAKKERKIKIIVSFRSFHTHNLNFQKNCKKIKKIKKSQFGLILIQNSSEKNEKERK